MKITKNELLLYNKNVRNCQFFKINIQCLMKKDFSNCVKYLTTTRCNASRKPYISKGNLQKCSLKQT